MARPDWRQYYGFIIEVPSTGAVFVHSRLYGTRERLDRAVRAAGKYKSLRVLGTVRLRGQALADQQALYKRTLKL